MSKRRKELDWPTREVTRDELGRIVCEHHIYDGQVIAKATFDPEENYRTSYSSGGVTLFFNREGTLTRKEVRNDGNELSIVETYSSESGQLHSDNGAPSRVKYASNGNVIYFGWHKDGKKHRVAKYNKNDDKLVPLPAIVRQLPEGITEHAYYREDTLSDPEPNFAAIQYQNEQSEIVLRCHFKENVLHNTEDPAILAEHNTSKLIAHARNGRVLKARFEEPVHTVDYTFNEFGEQVAQREEIDFSAFEIDDATFLAMSEKLTTRVADEESDQYSQPDPRDPEYQRQRKLKNKFEGGDSK